MGYADMNNRAGDFAIVIKKHRTIVDRRSQVPTARLSYVFLHTLFNLRKLLYIIDLRSLYLLLD